MSDYDYVKIVATMERIIPMANVWSAPNSRRQQREVSIMNVFSKRTAYRVGRIK